MKQRCAFGFFALLTACAAVGAADIGGWMQQQERVQTNPDNFSCVQLAAMANREPSAAAAYRTALCYLHGSETDPVAAKAWLSQAAQQNHLPAHRMLTALLRAEAAQHPSTPHCHDLGEGRQLCHGGQASPRKTASQ